MFSLLASMRLAVSAMGPPAGMSEAAMGANAEISFPSFGIRTPLLRPVPSADGAGEQADTGQSEANGHD